ncbi:MAG: hydroxyacid dehydrogenase [Candidatus Micrarchaeota archaeon]
MSRIVISDNMESEVVELLREVGEVSYKPENLEDALKDAEALVIRSATKATKELLDKAPNLKVVARAGVGLDNVDQEECKRRGIKVVNTPGASSNAVAEMAIGLAICGMRNVQKAQVQMKNKIWGKKNLVGREIEGKTLGVIGYGRIGHLVGLKAHSLGMEVIAYNPPPRHEDGIVRFIDDYDEFLGKADIFTIHCILTDETRNMINKEAISKMRDGAMIINLARGEIIEEDALYDGCRSGKLLCAAIDVFPKEPYTGKLLELDNVYMTPHIGGSTKEAQLRIGEELVKKIREEL